MQHVKLGGGHAVDLAQLVLQLLLLFGGHFLDVARVDLVPREDQRMAVDVDLAVARRDFGRQRRTDDRWVGLGGRVGQPHRRSALTTPPARSFSERLVRC